MPGKPATPEQRQRALEIYRTDGPSEAARQTGFSKASVCSWAKQAGIKTEAPQLIGNATAVSVARRKLSMAEWREEMTELLRDISVQAATVENKLLMARGKNTPTLERATSARVKSISDLMLLTGEATQRIGLSGDVNEQAEKVARLRDELAERRKKVLLSEVNSENEETG
jgi:hypothetical protein